MRAPNIVLSTVAVLALATSASSQAPPLAPAATPKAKPAPPPPPLLEGVVRGPDRKPVADALVAAEPAARRYDPSGRSPVSSTRTDPAGRFLLTLRAREPHTVRVEAPGLAAAVRREVSPGTPLAFDLTMGATIEGTVRDGESGEPAADVRVVAAPNDLRAQDGSTAGRVVTRTDARGRFRLAGLANGRYGVTASGRGRGADRRGNVRPGGRVDLLLHPSGSIFGSVLGADGRPVVGATVTVARGPLQLPGVAEPTDARGAFELGALAPGSYDVIAQAKGLAPAVVSDVTIDRRTDAPVEMVLRPGARVVGRLLDGKRPAAGGAVALAMLDARPLPPALNGLFSVDAGADGRFVLEGVPPGEHVLRLTAQALGRQKLDMTVRAGDAQVDIGDVRLQGGLAIRGRVRSKAGAPIADAVVSTWIPRADEPRIEDRTAPDGTFVLPGLEAGTHGVSVEASGYAPLEKTAEAGTPIEVVLSPAGAITGRAVGDGGEALDGVRATADTGGDYGRGRTDLLSSEGTADDGAFRISNVPAGTYELTVASPERLVSTVPRVVVGEGQVVDVGTVRLAPGGIVRGTVVDGTGAAVEGASVLVGAVPRGRKGSGVPGADVVTDADGAFEMKGLAAGSVELAASHPSYTPSERASVEVDLARPTTDVRLVLTRGGRIQGTVRTRGGGGNAGVRVSGMLEERRMPLGMVPMVSAVTAADGTFVLEPVPVGRVRLTAIRGHEVIGASIPPVEVREGETTTVDVDDDAVLLTGRVTRRGAPAAGIQLLARPSPRAGGVVTMSGHTSPGPGPHRLAAVTHDDGSFEMVLNEPGPHSIEATTQDGVKLPWRSFDVPDAETHAIELAYEGVPVAGVVVDEATDEPVPMATVHARPRQGNAGGGNAQAGRDGRFKLDLEPGDYVLAATDLYEGHRPAEATATVGPAGLADVRLALSKGAALSGTVTQQDGTPAVDVFVEADDPAHPNEDSGGRARTRADGSFEILGVQDRAFTVTAGGPDGAFGFQKDVRPGTPTKLALRPGGRLTVVVKNETGEPVPNAWASVTRVDGIPYSNGSAAFTASDSEGRVRMAAPAGTLTLLAHEMIPGWPVRLRGTASVLLEPGANASVDVEVRTTP